MSSTQPTAVQRPIQQDWANREYIEVITCSIKKISDFLNSFGMDFLPFKSITYRINARINSFHSRFARRAGPDFGLITGLFETILDSPSVNEYLEKRT